MRLSFVTPLFPTPEEPLRGTFNYKLVAGLRRFGEVEVLSPRAAIPLRGSLRPRSAAYRSRELGRDDDPIPVTWIPYPSLPFISRPVNWASCATRILPHLADKRPDLVLASWVYPEGYGALKAARKLGIPVVMQALGTDLRHKRGALATTFIRRALTQADAVLTVSRELKQCAMGYGADPAKIFPVLNGSDPEVFHPRDRALMRATLGVEPAAELVLFVGSLIPTKGIHELLDALFLLSGQRPNLQAAIIGSGPLKEDIASRVQSSAFTDRFHLLGPQSAWNVAQWLGAADLLCLPSYSEGCPNVVLEALSSGRPVVASNVGGIPELVSEGTGVTMNPRDTPALGQAIETVLSRPWDPGAIARTAGRTWQQAAAETWQICEETWKNARQHVPPAAPSGDTAGPWLEKTASGSR